MFNTADRYAAAVRRADALIYQLERAVEIGDRAAVLILRPRVTAAVRYSTRLFFGR